MKITHMLLKFILGPIFTTLEDNITAHCRDGCCGATTMPLCLNFSRSVVGPTLIPQQN